LDAAVNGLKELDYDFPKTTTQEDVQKHLGQILAYFADHPIPEFYDHFLMTDERYLAIMKIMDNLTAPLYLGGKTGIVDTPCFPQNPAFHRTRNFASDHLCIF
jgi:hypothetical protein